MKMTSGLAIAAVSGSLTFVALAPWRPPEPEAPSALTAAPATPAAPAARDHRRAATRATVALPVRRPSRDALSRLVGQKFMVAYRGRLDPPAQLMRRIRRGEVGGVILFPENVPATGARRVRALTARLQRAAAAGHNPPLLIASDQEGGAVRRLPGPPAESPAEMAARGPVAAARAGLRTGRSLRAMGVNVELAPVADLPSDQSSFLAARAFTGRRRVNQRAALGFSRGVQRARVAATAKHYPGLGTTGAANTDTQRVVVSTPRSELERQRTGFLRQVAAGTQLVMVSSAVYRAYDPSRPAVLSSRILGRLRQAGFDGVIVSDELRTPALAGYGASVPLRASQAGVDLLLYSNSDGADAYASLLRQARVGGIGRARLEEQVRRIITLKRWLAEEQS